MKPNSCYKRVDSRVGLACDDSLLTNFAEPIHYALVKLAQVQRLVIQGKTLKMNFHNYLRFTRNSLILPFIVIGSIVMNVSLSAEDIVEEQFLQQSGGGFVADVIFTNVHVGEHQGDNLEIKLVREVHSEFLADASTILADHNVSIGKDGSNVFVEIKPTRQTLRKWSREYGRTPLDSKLFVRIPIDYNVDLESISGKLTIDEVGGNLRAESVSGSVKVGHARSNTVLASVSGRIKIESSQNNVEISTVSGRIDVGDVEGDTHLSSVSGKAKISNVGGKLKSSSVSGATEIQSVLGSVNMNSTSGKIVVHYLDAAAEISNVSGSIALGLPRTKGYDFKLHSMSGRVTTDFPVEGSIKRNKIEGTVNGGGQRIALSSASGSLIVSEMDEGS